MCLKADKGGETSSRRTFSRKLQKAERIVAQEIERLGWTEEDLHTRRKGDQRKVMVARRLRQETTMSLKWIAQRLQMGSWTYVSNLLHRERPATSQSHPQLPLVPLCQ